MIKSYQVKVYSPNRKHVITTVSNRTSSIGAAKAAGSLAAERATINGEWCWIAKNHYGYKPQKT